MLRMVPPQLLSAALGLLAVTGLSAQTTGDQIAGSQIAGSQTAGNLAASDRSAVDFVTAIRPLLQDKCYACHGPSDEKREAGLRYDRESIAKGLLESGHRAIVPGDVSQSELVERINATDPRDRMPPPKSGLSLTAEERAQLTRWIAEGAHWEDQWSFEPVQRPAVPAVTLSNWPRNPIDSFVLQRLELQSLEATGARPNAAATREQLIRRVTYDLTGLPPTLEAIDAFTADSATGAYGRVVDRLFDSPAYAEHQARGWLDLARFGDTHGLHLDNIRSLWPYRDWVIDAFRSNKPFDEFTIEQLAGDLLPAATNAQIIATGFNRCNVTTGEGGLIVEEYLALYAVDRVVTASTVWLGLTVNCAQCHNHKYDPLTQKEFYQLFAFFNNVDEEGTDRNALTPRPMIVAPTSDQQGKLAELKRTALAIAHRLEAPMPAVDAAQTQWESEWSARLKDSWHSCEPLSAHSRDGATLTINADGTICASGTSPEHDVYEIVVRTDQHDIKALRIEALVDKDSGGVGRASHHNVVLTDVKITAAPANTPDQTSPVTIAAASADYSQRDFPVHKALDDDPASGWAIDKGNRDRSLVFGLDGPLPDDGGTVFMLRLAFESPFKQHTIARLRVSVATRETVRPAQLGTWHSIGPFKAKNSREAFDTDYGTESHVDVTSECTGQSWKKRPDLIDEKIHKLTATNSAFYFTRTIDAPGPRPMTLLLGSDDAIKIWLDGELVLENFAGRAVAADQERVTVQLHKGKNQLLVKIVNGGGPGGYYFRVLGEDTTGLPTDLIAELTSPTTDPKTSKSLRTHFRRHHAPAWKALDVEHRAALAQQRAFEKNLPRTMVMKERAKVRPAHFLVRGAYDRKGDIVERDVPAFLPPLPESERPVDRLTLARWLVDPKHPLTARVTVNRMWQSVFGIGLVKTSEDLGTRGEQPSHPELLDWLAREFVDSGWDMRHILRLILTSNTYRQTSSAPTAAFTADPENRLLARGPRFRLDAEAIRDSALMVSGLLVQKVGGPSVKPYQPTGIWKAVGYTSSNTANFKRDVGDALYRRSMYTFWKRTAPPPTMQILDAPSRETCTVMRARTNTPLQALAMQNDVQFVEAARATAERILKHGGSTDRERLVYAFRIFTARVPDPTELALLEDILGRQLADFGKNPAAARELIRTGESKPDASLDPAALAAWTTIANMIFNLDETVTKN